MKKSISITLFAGLMVWLSIQSCKKETISPDSPEPVSFAIPSGWPEPKYTFANNTLTQAGFVLGRKLFYDVRLSRDNTVSCGSCHQQFASFSHLDHPVSHGIANRIGTRNTPGLANMAWHPAYFWDGGVNNLESQPINPIQNHLEMDMTLPELISKLSADANYRKEFKTAFGDETINSQRIFKAFAQFMGTMVSSDSRYDKYTRNEEGAAFTDKEARGLSLFREKCGACHTEPLFSDFSYRNNGIAPDAVVNDSGRAHITRNVSDLYKFKVPSLRDVALTKPYMHDGRFLTLEAVVAHYRTGISPSATLDPILAGGVSMTDDEQSDIVSFLQTLTDTTFVKDVRFAEPK